jgi:hypothetical protein
MWLSLPVVLPAPMNYLEEFRTVDIIVASSTETRGVDAFALSIIKAERQIRRLFTHLVYQFLCFGASDVVHLRKALAYNERVYFRGLVRGFDALYPRSVKTLVGTEYDRLRGRIDDAIKHRNKIFHGQLTSSYLSREDLLDYVTDIRLWCRTIAESSLIEFNYDGFARNSFQKSTLTELYKSFNVQLNSVESYTDFIRRHMQRRR